MMSRSRLVVILVILVGLVLSTWTRHVAAVRRGERDLAAATPLSRMNSYALALLLGGLRGPLVMFLWPSAEGQKTERNLEDFDTKVEWIRLLQAEFDTVHIFQIWNKAYNISVMMANLGNKYSTILDALDYGRQVDAERPANINILTAIAGIYADKLGTSAEKDYYKERIREETQARTAMMRVTFPAEKQQQFIELAQRAGASASRLRFTTDPASKQVSVTIRRSIADAMTRDFSAEDITWQERPRQTMNPAAPGFRRVELDPMLDEQGRVLPHLFEPRRAHRARVTGAAPVGGNDGSELQYLKQFEPYPYGISAHALGYNYYKRAQTLLRQTNQQHAQLSDLVIDSRPALTLRNWSEDEWERGIAAELEGFARQTPSEPEPVDVRIRRQLVTHDLPLDAQPVNPAALRQAIFEFERSSALAAASLDEYRDHLEHYRTNFTTYRAHMDRMEAHAALTRGDADFLRLIVGEGDRSELIARASANYNDARRRFQMHVLMYYVELAQVQNLFPDGVTQDTVQQLTPDQYGELAERVREDVDRRGSTTAPHFDEYLEYFSYIRRAQARLNTLGAMTN